MRALPLSLLALTSWMPLACGGSSKSLASAASSSSSSSSGTTSASSASASSRVASSSASGAAGSAATGGASSSATSSGGAGGSSGAGGAAGVACPASGGFSANGTLLGQSLMLSDIPVSESNLTNGFGAISIGPDGLLVFAGPTSLPVGQPSPISGFFELPVGSLEAHVWFALGAGSTVTPSPGGIFSFALSGLSWLGSCPAPSGSGSLDYCYDGATLSCNGAGSSTTGAVDGMAFNWNIWTANNASASKFDALQWTNGAILAFLVQGGSEGVLFMPPNALPDPGAFYCIGTRSESGDTLLFGDFTRLGPARPGATDGSFVACYAE